MKLVKQKDFAELAKIVPGNVAYLRTKDEFKGAFQGKKIDLEHSAVIKYIQRRNPAFNPLGKPEKISSLPLAERGLFDFEVENIEELQGLTLREIVKKYGGIAGFKEFVSSQKLLAEYERVELRLLKEKGELIERKLVSGVVFGYLKLLVSKLYNDLPRGLSEKITRFIKIEKNPSAKIIEEYKRQASRIIEDSRRQIEEIIHVSD